MQEVFDILSITINLKQLATKKILQASSGNIEEYGSKCLIVQEYSRNIGSHLERSAALWVPVNLFMPVTSLRDCDDLLYRLSTPFEIFCKSMSEITRIILEIRIPKKAFL